MIFSKSTYRLFVALLVFFCIGLADATAQPWLKKAETLYDDGQIEKVPELTSQKKREIARDLEIKALRLSILSFIYNDNWRLADSTMLRLLLYENEYTLLQEDSATEYHYLYESYRVTPVYALGLSGGFNFSRVDPFEYFGTYNLNNAKGDYGGRNMGFHFGVNFSFYLDQILSGLGLNFEAKYSFNNFEYKNQLFDFANLSIRETRSSVFVPIYLSYSINLSKRNAFYSSKIFDKISVYPQVGVMPSFLLSDKCEAVRSYTDKAHNDIKASDINLISQRKRLNLAVTAGVGLQYKVKMGYVFFDFKYYYGLNNAVNQKSRFANNELIYNFYHLDDNYRMDFFEFSFGYKRLIYSPKKILKKGYNYYQP